MFPCAGMSQTDTPALRLGGAAPPEKPLEGIKGPSLGPVEGEDVTLPLFREIFCKLVGDREEGKERARPGRLCLTPCSLWPQHTACGQEGSLPQLSLHGLAGDPLAGPETPCHPHPREPGERADLLLPIKPPQITARSGCAFFRLVLTP